MGPVADADVVVIGGGPVGLATALYAVRAGLVPVLLEPRAAPIDKACGEGLMPGAVAALGRLGAPVTGRPFLGIRYVDGARSVEARFRGGPGLGVRRTELHAALAAAAERAGVEVVPRAMSALTQDPTGVRVDLDGAGPSSGVRSGPSASVRGRFVVAADGLHSPTRRLLGLDVPPRGVRRFGLRRHFRVGPWTDLVEVHWSPAGEAYVTPVADDEVGVALLGSGRGSWQDRLQDFPALRERLAGAEPTSTVLGAGPLRQRSRSRRAGRVVLVGDAGGYVDALTGEGLAVGLAQARAAATALAAGRPQLYPRAAARVSLPSAALTSGLLASTRTAPGRRAVLTAAHRAPWLFDQAVNALAHD
ncbi:FAD-dependent monooxygenase [Ornithinimicrobium sp. F0845]|uniref:NAD(P)/FAD-dependent oxidoreductase n=1 Tax=Ornithinimicrobium sp. F0845 TaxID=2926412 RepID=UPI001FF29B35|nr:FAD-dependent monooxygenase [Ornithinimicrobium sp. F0845]MCK0112553.1 FAD-dependent monooxygenase [Ornithinimicrobium sp. F0845]